MAGALVDLLTVNGLTNIPVDFVNCYERGLVPPVIFFEPGMVLNLWVGDGRRVIYGG
jgi:hypothetical protein